MDTNLMDSCNEVQQQTVKEIDTIENVVVANIQQKNCEEKLQIKIDEGFPVDSRSLRKWLNDMEQRMWKTPTLSEAMKMKSGELQKRLTEHSVSFFLLLFFVVVVFVVKYE